LQNAGIQNGCEHLCNSKTSWKHMLEKVEIPLYFAITVSEHRFLVVAKIKYTMTVTVIVTVNIVPG
jgi:hypothetical protein